MLPEGFWKWYLILCMPNIIVFAVDIIDRIRNKNKECVRVSLFIVTICFMANFVSILGAVSNGLAYLSGDEDVQLWFIAMMCTCYIGLLTINIITHNVRVLYSLDDDDITVYTRLKKKKLSISEISRINLSAEYLDIYINDVRIRCDNIFLVGAEEFECYVKNYMKNRY